VQATKVGGVPGQQTGSAGSVHVCSHIAQTPGALHVLFPLSAQTTEPQHIVAPAGSVQLAASLPVSGPSLAESTAPDSLGASLPPASLASSVPLPSLPAASATGLVSPPGASAGGVASAPLLELLEPPELELLEPLEELPALHASSGAPSPAAASPAGPPSPCRSMPQPATSTAPRQATRNEPGIPTARACSDFSGVATNS
jgi:hypothetical protein